MDHEEALEILEVSELSNFDSFTTDISRNWKKLLIKYQGNDKELSRVNRAYDLLRRISKDKFDKFLKDENIEKDIFIKENNKVLFYEKKNSSKIKFGIDIDEKRESFERYNFENYQQLNNDINSEDKFNLSKSYTFEPGETFNLYRYGFALICIIIFFIFWNNFSISLPLGGVIGSLIFGEINVKITNRGVRCVLFLPDLFFPYELIKNISKTNKGVRLLLSRKYKSSRVHIITCFGDNDELYECLNFFYLNYKND